MNVEHLIDESDECARTCRTDDWNPHRPECELNRHILAYAIREGAKAGMAPEAIATEFLEWLAGMYEETGLL